MPADLLCGLPTPVAYFAGPEHLVELANSAFEDLAGSREVLGRPAGEVLPVMHHQEYAELLDRVLVTGRPVRSTEMALEIRGSDGHLRRVFVDLAHEPVRDDAGVVIGILVQASDVTPHVMDRRRLEQLTAELASAEDRYRTLFETMPHGVVYHARDGSILEANPAAARMLGAAAEALVGLRPQDPTWQAVREDGSAFPGEEHPVMLALRTGTVAADVVMGTRHGRTGERRWLSVTAVPDARDDHGRPQRAYAMFTDVTEPRRTTAALREREQFLGRLRDTNVLGVIVADEEHGVLDANDAYLQMVGCDRADLQAGRVDWRALTPPEWLPLDEAGLEQLRRTGACRPFEKEYLLADGRRVPVLLGGAAISRQPLRWVAFVTDLSERQRAEEERAVLIAHAEAARTETDRAQERLGFLLRAGALAAATHDPHQLLAQVTRLVVPALADFAAVFLPGADGSLRATALEHHDPAHGRVLATLTDYHVTADSNTTIQAAYRTGLTQLHRDVGAMIRHPNDIDPGIVDLSTMLRIDSLIAVPLVAGARRLGVLLLGRCAGRTAFDGHDVGVAEELGRRVTAGLANTEAFAREHTVAEILQRSVLPDDLPALPGMDLAIRYLPATEGVDVGGDWYDAFALGGRRVGLVLGDVVGHNLASASAMSQIRNALRAYAVDDPDPSAVLRRTNTAVAHLLPDTMATVFYAVLDLATGEMAYANAGHPPPLLTSASGARYLAAPSGLMLGVADGVEYSTGTARLACGDTVLLYSDGLVEDRARSIDECFDALAAAYGQGAGTTADEMCATAQATLPGATDRADDICLLAVRLTGCPAPAGGSGVPATTACRRTARDAPWASCPAASPPADPG